MDAVVSLYCVDYFREHATSAISVVFQTENIPGIEIGIDGGGP